MFRISNRLFAPFEEGVEPVISLIFKRERFDIAAEEGRVKFGQSLPLVHPRDITPVLVCRAGPRVGVASARHHSEVGDLDEGRDQRKEILAILVGTGL